MILLFYFWVYATGIFQTLVLSQRFQVGLDGAIDGSFVNSPASSGRVVKSPWRNFKTLYVEHLGLSSTLSVDYDQLTETVSLAKALSHYMSANDAFDYGLTAHLFTSASSIVNSDPLNVEAHVLLHAATDVPAFHSNNVSNICITVAFKSDNLQSHSVCSITWPYDNVCIIGRPLDRRWFVGNKPVNVSFSLSPVTSPSQCTISFQERLDKANSWHNVGQVISPAISEANHNRARLFSKHRVAKLSSSEVGRGRPQISLLLPPKDAFFRAGDLLRLPVHLNAGNSLSSLLIRVNASSSLQLSEMRLLHPDWRLSIISDSSNRVAVIRATADLSSNSSVVSGGPLLEYDFRVISVPENEDGRRRRGTSVSSDDAAGVKTDANLPHRDRSWTKLNPIIDSSNKHGKNYDKSAPPSPQINSAALTWEVEMVSRDSAAIGLAAVDATFRLDNDPIMTIVPVIKNFRIFNYAVLRNSIQRIPIWLYGFTAQSGLVQLWDASCTSSEPAAVKVESLCRYIYLDGSESKGSNNVTIAISRRRLTTSIRLQILFPTIPLNLEIADTNLQVIRNFLVPYTRRSHRGDEIGNKADRLRKKCRPHFQRTSLRAFAHFSSFSDISPLAVDVEVTDWVLPLVRISNSSVVRFDGVSLVGVSPGSAKVQLVTTGGFMMASRSVIVTSSYPVTITRLDALIADRIEIEFAPSKKFHSKNYVADTSSDDSLSKSTYFDVVSSLRKASSAQNFQVHNLPTASPSRLFVMAHFSDGTFLDLAMLPSEWYELSIQPSTSPDAAVPRVALFEVAKCRRQSIEGFHPARRTTHPLSVTQSPLSVIRIDGSELMAAGEYGAYLSSYDDTDVVRRREDQESNNTTVILGALLGILLALLLLLALVVFRRRLTVIIQNQIDNRRPLRKQVVLFCRWVTTSRFADNFVTYVIEKPRHFFHERWNIHVNPASRHASNDDDDNDNDTQSCGGEETEMNQACEPTTRTDRNWVWLSRETLEKHSVDTMRSHPLLPDAAFRNLCCSAGSGTGTGSRSPAISTTGSNASRSGRSSAALLIKTSPAISNSCEDNSDARVESQIDFLPKDSQNSVSPVDEIIKRSSLSSNSERYLEPTVYAGSECSLRILPCQPWSKHGSTAALQLVAPDGRLMATAFASRTLNSDYRRPRHQPSRRSAGASDNRSSNNVSYSRVNNGTITPSNECDNVVSNSVEGMAASKNNSCDEVRFTSLQMPSPARSKKSLLANSESNMVDSYNI